MKIIFLSASGHAFEVNASPGRTLMEAARDNNIPGIEAECGGACACATCHVHIAPDWYERVGPPNEYETQLLGEADNSCGFSRLACQVPLTDQIAGLIVRVANGSS